MRWNSNSVPPKPFDRPAGRSKRQFDLPAAGQIDSAAAQNDLCVEQVSYSTAGALHFSEIYRSMKTARGRPNVAHNLA